MASGIYAIVHRDSGRWYVGQSGNIKNRWSEHRWLLRRGLHHSPHLQHAWVKYGEQAFRFEVLILAPVWALNDLEQAYLDDPETSHFNIAKCAEASTRGLKHTPETRAKMSAAGKGRKKSPEHRAKISEAHKGKKGTPHTPESREKMRAAQAGRNGRRHSEETRRKISEATKGRKLSPEHLAKLIAANTGRVALPETIAKRRATMEANRPTKVKR